MGYVPRYVKKLDTRKHDLHKQVPMPDGTCFVMHELAHPDGTRPDRGPNKHPFVVLQSSKDGLCVLCAMAQTLLCEYEDKDNAEQFERHKDIYMELMAPNPPMESRDTRMQFADMSNLVWLPKKALFDSPSFRICQTDARNEPSPVLDSPVDVRTQDGRAAQRSQIFCLKAKASQLNKQKLCHIHDPYKCIRMSPEERQARFGLDGYENDPLYERILRQKERADQREQAAKDRKPVRQVPDVSAVNARTPSADRTCEGPY